MQVKPILKEFEIPMTKDDVLSILKITPLTLQREMQANNIGFIRIGYTILFSAENVNDYIKSKMVKAKNTKTIADDNA